MTDVCISPADTPARPSLVFESALLPLAPPLLLLLPQQTRPIPPAMVQQHCASLCCVFVTLSSLFIPHSFTPSSSTHTQTHTLTHNSSTVQLQLMEHSGWRADVKMDERGDRQQLQCPKVDLFFKERERKRLKQRCAFRKQGGLSLMKG